MTFIKNVLLNKFVIKIRFAVLLDQATNLLFNRIFVKSFFNLSNCQTKKMLILLITQESTQQNGRKSWQFVVY